MFAAKETFVTSPFIIPRPVRRNPWTTVLCIVASDVAALGLVFVLLVASRQMLSPAYTWSGALRYLPFFMLAFPAFVFQGLYPGLLIHPAEEMRRVFFSLSCVFLIWASAAFLWRSGELYSRSVFLIGWVVSAPTVLLARHFTRVWLSKRSWWGVPAVILGSGPIAQRVARKLRDGRLGIRVAGIFSEAQILSWEYDMPPILGDLAAASEIGHARAAEYAIIALPYKSNLELRYLIEDYCRGFRHVLLVPDVPGVCSLGVKARDIDGELGLEVPQKLFHSSSALVKRLVDIMASAALLVTLSPLLAVIAILIRTTSKGPVFYGHQRHGRDGRVFRALKFRTMVPNADRVLADYLVSHTEYAPEWERTHKLKNDPRITRVGKWLRRASLDELPQLINILCGQMSLVGPRPIVQQEIARYGRSYALYRQVLPGLTGLWQVSGRNNTTYEERIAYDEHYVHNWSVWLDLYILVRTIKVVISAEGAY